jgi:hypothetical protein
MEPQCLIRVFCRYFHYGVTRHVRQAYFGNGWMFKVTVWLIGLERAACFHERLPYPMHLDTVQNKHNMMRVHRTGVSVSSDYRPACARTSSCTRRWLRLMLCCCRVLAGTCTRGL